MQYEIQYNAQQHEYRKYKTRRARKDFYVKKKRNVKHVRDYLTTDRRKALAERIRQAAREYQTVRMSSYCYDIHSACATGFSPRDSNYEE